MTTFLLASTVGTRLLSAASGGVDVDFNPALVLMQFALVTGLVFVLKPMLFEPLLNLFEEREKRSEGARAEARAMDDEAADLLRQYEHEIGKVTRVASEERDKMRTEAQRLEAVEMAEAKAEVEALVSQRRATLKFETGATERELTATTEDLSRDIASRVLGRELR